MKRKKSLIIVLFLLAAAILWFVILRGDGNSPLAPSAERKPVYSLLTGVEIDNAKAEQPILGVMIENSEEARPQTGLDSAGIVFEALSEGGITRYLALYQETLPETVGPIRSLRTHFLDWAMGFDASIVHVGGSPDALDQAEKRNSKNLNEFSFGDKFYRDSSRVAPHNMYARTENLIKLQKDEGHKMSEFAVFPRKDDSPNPTPQAPNVTVDYSHPLFQAKFQYDPSINSYIRYLAGEPHIDNATGKAITVKNVVIIKSTGQDAIGEGEALIFMDGDVTTGRWQLPNYTNRIKLTDASGNELPLNRGDSWFLAVPTSRTVTY